jgi:hypothetical protein
MQAEFNETKPTDQITIALAEDASGALRPLSIDLEANALQVVFSARQTRTIDRVLNADFARTVRGICLGLPPELQIINAPEFRTRTCGLVIEGYTALANTLEDGLRRFTIRLGRVSGNGLAVLDRFDPDEDRDAVSLFRSEVLRGLDRHVDADRLFDEMLAHLYLPLVNLNSYMRSVLDGQASCSAEDFSASAVQLKARAEHLQFAFDRMISELMVQRVSPPEPLQMQSLALHEDPAPAPRAPTVVGPDLPAGPSPAHSSAS